MSIKSRQRVLTNVIGKTEAIFIVRQHAERDIVIPILSVSLSACPVSVLSLKEWTYRHIFDCLVGASF